MLVLFNGTGSVEKVIHSLYKNAEVVTVDWDAQSRPTHCADVRKWEKSPSCMQYPKGHFDVVWASPPCTEYSQAKTTGTRRLKSADATVQAALRIISRLKPRFWFMENPKGRKPFGLRTRRFMAPYAKFCKQCTYCKYGTAYRKSTNIWTNAPVGQLEYCDHAHGYCKARSWLGYHPARAQRGPCRAKGVKILGHGGNSNRVYPIPDKLLRHLFGSMAGAKFDKPQPVLAVAKIAPLPTSALPGVQSDRPLRLTTPGLRYSTSPGVQEALAPSSLTPTAGAEMQNTSAEGAAALGAQLPVHTQESPTGVLGQPEAEATRRDRALDQMLAKWAKEEKRREAEPRLSTATVGSQTSFDTFTHAGRLTLPHPAEEPPRSVDQSQHLMEIAAAAGLTSGKHTHVGHVAREVQGAGESGTFTMNLTQLQVSEGEKGPQAIVATHSRLFTFDAALAAEHGGVRTKISALFDSGASGNFISDKLATQLGCTRYRTKETARVQVADGTPYEVKEYVVCPIYAGEYTAHLAMHVLPLDLQPEVILGVPWVETFERGELTIETYNRILRFSTERKDQRIQCHQLPTPQIDQCKAYFDVITLEQAHADIKYWEQHDPETLDQCFGVGYTLKTDKNTELGLESLEEGGEPSLMQMSTNDKTICVVNKGVKIKKEGSFERRDADYEDPDDADSLPHCEPERVKLFTRFGKDGTGTAVDELPGQFASPEHRAKGQIHMEPAKAHWTPYRKPYKMNPVAMLQLREQVQELLAKGHIRESSSPFGAPALMVPKPHEPGKWRLCIDYRELNSAIVRDRFTIPTTAGILDRLHGSKVFSTLDLLWGFWQIAMDPKDIEKTAFVTDFGSYEWKCLPMGLKNSPSIFQRIMRQTLGHLPFVEVYIDDILVHSKTEEEHFKHLEQVFECLHKEGLFVKRKKCKLFQKSVKFLGHVLTADGVKPQHSKCEAVQAWPPLLNASQVRQFLGLTGYYRQFIPGFATIAKPLFDATKNDHESSWKVMTPEMQQAQQQLKDALCGPQVLVIPDQQGAWDGSRPYFVVPDVSQVAVGAVLMQDQGKGLQPIAFESKALTAAQQNWTTTDRELFGVIHACQTWKRYLETAEFRVVGDHKPLEALFSPTKELSRRQARWVEFLTEVGMSRLIHVPGKTLIPSDAFSRRPDYKQSSPKEGLDEWRKQTEQGIISNDENVPLRVNVWNHTCPKCWQRQCSCGRTHSVNGLHFTSDPEQERACIRGTILAMCDFQLCGVDREERNQHRAVRQYLRDNQDWKFDEVEVKVLSNRYGPFTVDACCDDAGNNAQVHGPGTKYFSKGNSCLRNSCAGHRTWINPPFNDTDTSVERILKWFAECRADKPHSTSAVVVLPHWAVPPRHRLKALGVPDMKLVATHKEGEKLFTSPNGTKPEVQWEVQVFHIPALETPGKVVDAEHLPTAPTEQSFVHALRAAQQEDATCQERVALLNEGNFYSKDGYCLKGGLLWRISEGHFQVVVPEHRRDLQQVILEQAHDVPGAGHMGQRKTLDRIRRQFWWPTMSKCAHKWVEECPTCQTTKSPNRKAGETGWHEVPVAPWHTVTMDFITGFDATPRGYNAIVTFTDSLTKMVHFRPLNFTGSDVETVARLFVETVWRQHGCPAKIVSDRDPRFTSAMWQCVMRLIGTRVACTAAYNPQADGQSERTNRTLEQMLRAFVGPRQHDWDLRLPMVEFAMNDAVHEITKHTPFYLNYGRHPRNNLGLLSGAVRDAVEHKPNPAAEVFFDELERDLTEVRGLLEAAKIKAKQRADKVRTGECFAIGQQVMLSSAAFTAPAHKDTKWKLRPKWAGPFAVTELVYDDRNARLQPADRGAPSAYRLLLPPTWRIHDVFTASKLKAYHAATVFPSRKPPPVPPTTAVEGIEEHQVESILAHRTMYNHKSRQHEMHWLVHWTGFTHEHDEWLPERAINAGSPNALWEKYEDNRSTANRQVMRLRLARVCATVVDTGRVLRRSSIRRSVMAQQYVEDLRICTVRKSGRTAIIPSSRRKSAHLVIGSSETSAIVKHIRSRAPSTMVVTLDATEGGRVNRTGDKFTHAVNLQEWLEPQQGTSASYQAYEPGHFEVVWWDGRNDAAPAKLIFDAVTKLNSSYYAMLTLVPPLIPDYDAAYVTQVLGPYGVWVTTSVPLSEEQREEIAEASSEAVVLRNLATAVTVALDTRPSLSESC